MISPNGCRCPPDCVGSQRACIKQSRSASGQRNREEGGRCAGGVHCRGVCFGSKQEPDCGCRLEVQFRFFLQFLQINFKELHKDQREDMRTCIAICRRGMSSEDLISYDMRRRKESQF